MKKRLVAGWIVSGLCAAFLLFDAVLHWLEPAPVVDAFNRMNFPLSLSPALAIIALVCVVVYAIPRTCVLGAILLTGYLGGAVATHLRIRDPLFDTIFPILFGILIWAGPYLRNPRLSAFIPIQKEQ
ncbi:MAG TPA: DoxX family protein [Bryobacteraceae bacterium]|nr:DoxX family protein [Bryobacteraceae bacterium]